MFQVDQGEGLLQMPGDFTLSFLTHPCKTTGPPAVCDREGAAEDQKSKPIRVVIPYPSSSPLPIAISLS